MTIKIIAPLQKKSYHFNYKNNNKKTFIMTHSQKNNSALSKTTLFEHFEDFFKTHSLEKKN